MTGEICFSQIAPRRGRPSLEALACVGNIAKTMGPTMEPHVRDLLDSMFSSGLSLPRQSASVSRGHITTVTPQVPELSGSALVQLALRTLARFNFKVCHLYFCAFHFPS